MTGPSNKAVDAAWQAWNDTQHGDSGSMQAAVEAAYPVIVAEIVEALHVEFDGTIADSYAVISFIEREFGGTD